MTINIFYYLTRVITSWEEIPSMTYMYKKKQTTQSLDLFSTKSSFLKSGAHIFTLFFNFFLIGWAEFGFGCESVVPCHIAGPIDHLSFFWACRNLVERQGSASWCSASCLHVERRILIVRMLKYPFFKGIFEFYFKCCCCCFPGDINHIIFAAPFPHSSLFKKKKTYLFWIYIFLVFVWQLCFTVFVHLFQY